MQGDDPEIRRVVLAGMRQAVPDARTEARVLSGLLAQISSVPPPDGVPDGGGAAIAGSAGIGTALKVIAGATILATAIVGGSIVATRKPADVPTEAVTPKPRESAPTVPTAPQVVPTPQPPVAPPAVAPAIAPVAPTAPAQPAAPRPDPALAPAIDDGLAAETEILAAAEAALATGDPTRALELAAAHAERHPKGQLALERDAIATAAACVAKHADASEAAARFERDHPQTAAAAKVRARCGPSAKKSEAQ
jgi:hypothetical protein